MLSDVELTDALERVEYKPGWRFQLYRHPFEGMWIAIRYTDRNSYHPDNPWDVCVRSALPDFDTAEQFWAWLQWRLLRIETHESLEWYRVDGVPLNDPHAEEYNE